jgi:amidase
MGSVAHGSDGGGSIRIPSAWCGVFGIKPARGRVSAAPAPQSWNATSGPIARTVADAAALLDVMQGYVRGDVWWLSPPERPYVEEVGAPTGRLRIAWTADHPDPDMQVEPAWRDAVMSTVELLADEGHEVVEAVPPALDFGLLALVPASSVATRADLPPLDTLDTTNRTLVTITEAASAIDLADALRSLQDETRRITAFFDDVDVLVTPTLAARPPRLGERLMGEEDWEGMLQLLRIVAFTPTWNMTGQPAVAVPAGLDDEGLPVSVQLVGGPADEVTLIRLAAWLEAARPWRDMRPPVCATADA